MAYDLRARKVNYKEVANSEFCKVGMRKRPREEKLYELEVIEKDRQNRHVKVYYVGYESEYDEWRDEKDVKIIYPVQSKLVFCCLIVCSSYCAQEAEKFFWFW
ncbi:MAG: hypothetical protein MJE68_01430 [Proteobacteria bacterium]|nr:hypothetical protein [Pseudomonadota bacterium]